MGGHVALRELVWQYARRLTQVDLIQLARPLVTVLID